VTTLDKDCAETDWKGIASEVSLDLWILRKFNCLPTEDKFKSLTEHQKVLLFYGYLYSPTDDQIREHYLSGVEPSTMISEDDKRDFVEVLGYTEEQVERMSENLKAAGLM